MPESMKHGIIVKGVGGLYFVKTADSIIQCKARGILKKKHIKPLVGDRVLVSSEFGTNMIEDISARKNQMIRPPVANIDQLFIVASTVEPTLNAFLIDKMTAIAEIKGIDSVIVITKNDISKDTEAKEIYEKAGFPVVMISYDGEDDFDSITKMLDGKISAFTGNSGVGKSTLLNKLFPNLDLQTGEISQKLGRGKHTTRAVELYPTGENGFVADTPGFSSLDIEKCEVIMKEDLPYAFREFKQYLGNCKFTSCTHTKEKECGIRQAVDAGYISQSRYNSYLNLYEEVKNLKEWEVNSKK